MPVLHLTRMPARIEGRTLACPHCGSYDVAYVEDVRSTHPVLRIDPHGELLVMGVELAGPPETKDEWIQCRACLKASEIPEDLATVFE